MSALPARPAEPSSAHAVHPGHVLASLLAAHGMTGADFAVAFGLVPGHVAALLACRARLTDDVAAVLAYAFGLRAGCWLAMQKAHDAEQRRTMAAV